MNVARAFHIPSIAASTSSSSRAPLATAFLRVISMVLMSTLSMQVLPHVPVARYHTLRRAHQTSSPIARSLPRSASGGFFQSLQGRSTIHTGAPYEVNRRGVDLVDERVDAQVARQILVLLEQRAGLASGLQGQPARLLRRNPRGLQVGGQGLRRLGQAADRSEEAFRDGIFGFGLDYGERGAGQRPHVAHRQVYLVGRGGVELHVPEAPPPGRGEAGGLPSGRDGLLQSAHPRVYL